MSKRWHFAAGFVTCAAIVVAIGWLAAVKAEDWLVMTCCSKHFDYHGQNQRNPGLGIETVVTPSLRAVAGFYDNSSNNLSTYIGASYQPWQAGPLRAGAVFGLITGYRYAVMPMVLPSVSIEGERFGANLYLAPVAGGVAGLQFKWRF